MFDERVWTHGYGYRARVGFLAPGIVDDNRMYEFYRMAPPGVIKVATHLGVSEMTVAGVKEALEKLDKATDRLAVKRVNIIVLGGSPPIIVGGLGSDEAIARRITERTGLPATTSQTAAVEALRLLGIGHVAVASPLPQELSALLRRFLEQSGFRVTMRSLDIPYSQVGFCPLSVSYNLARGAFQAAGDAQGIYIPVAGFPAVANIQRLEDELGVPVVTSLQGMCWTSLRRLGITDSIQGFGRLLRDH